MLIEFTLLESFSTLVYPGSHTAEHIVTPLLFKELLNIMLKDAVENEVRTQQMMLTMDDNDIIKKMTNRTIKEMK